MTKEEIIKANAEKGYIHVAEFDGHDLYKKENGAGGHSYFSDESGGYEEIWSMVWDDCLSSKQTLLAIAKDAYGLELK